MLRKAKENLTGHHQYNSDQIQEIGS
jgi:hypothetical protein